mgnify:FL=1
MIKRAFKFTILIALCMILTLQVAAAPVDPYTRVDVPGGSSENIYSREMYTATEKITANTLGLTESLEGISDIFSTSSGTVYILCEKPARVIRLNKDYTSAEEITLVDKSGNKIDYTGAKGIFCDSDDNIYIADTANARVLICNRQGVLQNEIVRPKTNLVPEDFIFSPTAIEKDKKGYTYILSDGCYYGALLYSPSNEFVGFYGSNTVKSTALDTLSYLWNELTSNDEKKANSLKTLPYSFTDFCLNSEGYLVTCTGSTEVGSNGEGQIRIVNAAGKNILYKRNLKGGSSTSDTVNFLEDQPVVRVEGGSQYISQNLISIAVNENGFILALDRTNCYIYLYDSECNLLSVFGGGLGKGKQLGVFKTPIAMTLCGDSVLVADADNSDITVFKPTEYAKLLFQAQNLYLKGDYEETKELWQKVLAADENNQLAYRGLAMVYYMEGNNRAALKAAKQASDYTVYDLAWSAVLSEFIANNFIWMILVLVLLVALIIVLTVQIKKKKINIVPNRKVKIALNSFVHPFRSFEAVKYENLGSVKISVVISVLLYLSMFLRETATGFLYRETTIKNYNSIYTLIGSIGFMLLWSVSNFLVTSLFSGKGSFKEIYISTAYSLIPFVIYKFICVILMNFLPLSASGVLNGIGTAVVLYTVFIFIISMMTMHEYDFFKFLWTTVITLFMMLLIVFAIFLCSILLTQLKTFLEAIVTELKYR